MGKNVWIREPMISADKLYERWTGIHGHEEELARLIDTSGDPFRDDNVPIAYRVQKVLKTPEKGIISYCEECIPQTGEKYYPPYKTNFQGDGTYFDFEGIAFLMSQITEYEKNRPELFYEVIENPDEAWASTAPLHPGLQTISAYEAICRLQITPIELVDILNGIEHCDENGYRIGLQRLITTDESEFRDFTYNEPYFTERSLEKVKIYYRDFDIYCEQWGVRTQVTSNGDDINNAIQEKDTELLRLKQECAEKQTTIQELEAQLLAHAAVPNKTAPASAAKQENALAAWKPVIPAMLEVYHQCLAEGPTQRTKKDLERLFSRQGVELTQAQMAFFRDCLPEGHVNKTGGATVQKS